MLKTIWKSPHKFSRSIQNNKFIKINFNEEFPMRIDNFLSKHFENKYSFSFLQKLIRKKEIRVNNEKIKESNHRINQKDEILIPKFLLEKSVEIKPIEKQKQKVNLTEEQTKTIQSWVLYMNEEVIVINKPSGISVQGGNQSDKFNIDAMLDALKFDSNETPKLVHRLDKVFNITIQLHLECFWELGYCKK
jgi:23S rRNA pseudouridine955/2504/2580 synthase